VRRILATASVLCVVGVPATVAVSPAAAQTLSPGGLGQSGPVDDAPPTLDDLGHRPDGVPTAPTPAPGSVPAADLPADWSLLGPPGGDVFGVAASPVDPDLVLAGTAPGGSLGGGLYRSTDGGETWAKVPAMAGGSVLDIAFAPDGRAYVGSADGVWTSPDAGEAWTNLDLGIGVNQFVFEVTIDPSAPETLWVGIGDAAGTLAINLMRSTDGGATWTNRTPPLPGPMSGQAVAVDPTDSDTVVALFGGAFGGGAVWVTTDGGDSWTNRSAGLPGNPLQAVVYDGDRLLVGGGQLFGSQHVGLYQSHDLGVTWTPLHDASWPILVVDAIAVDPADPDTILVATDGSGVHRTTDAGDTWELSVGDTGALSGRALRFRPGSSSELFLGTSSLAVFRSRDGGDSFTSSADGISELGLTSIAANPRDRDELAVSFEGQNNGGVMSSTDGGTTWTVEAAPPTRYSAVQFAPDGTLHALSSGPSSVAPEGLYRRGADGEWAPLGPDQGTLFESDLLSITFSEEDPDLIMLGGSDFGVAGNEATIWRTDDGGGAWDKVYEVGAVDAVADLEILADGTDQRMVAVWFDSSGENVGGALRSVDGGRSWSPSSAGLPAGFLRNIRLCASPSDAEVLYLSGWLTFGSGGVFRTDDGGENWHATGWTGPQINDIACDPVDDQVLYLSQPGTAQVVRSEDQGVTFAPFADGLGQVTAPGDLAFAGRTRLLLSSRQGSYVTVLREDEGGGPVGCDRTISGVHSGALTVSEGVTCLAAGAQVLGEVNVQAGAGLIAAAAVVQGPVSALGAAVLDLSFSQVTGPVLVAGSTGPVTLFASQVTGSVSLVTNATGDAPPVVSGNTVIGSLSCFGNQPEPTDHGLPNTATGGKLGQCAAL
jgi:photosystem II stability/assembly factor-like uncharacterized protein